MTFRYTRESSESVMGLVMTDQALHICLLHSVIQSVRAIWSCYVWLQDTTLRISSNTTALLAYDRHSGALENHQHMSWVALCQLQHSIFANLIWQWDSLGDIQCLDLNMRYGSLICGKAAAFAAIWLHVRCTAEGWVHILMTNRSLHICQSQWQLSQSSQYWVPVSEYEIQADLFVGKLQHFLADDRSSGVLEYPGNIVMTDPTQHISQSHLAIKSV